MDQWELNMPLENLTNDAFANRMADYYQKHIGAAEFKDIRSEITSRDNPQTPLWLTQPFIQRGIQKGKDNPSGKINFITAPVLHTARIAKFMASPNGLLFVAKQASLLASFTKSQIEDKRLPNIKLGIAQQYFPSPESYIGNPGPNSYSKKTPEGKFKSETEKKTFDPIEKDANISNEEQIAKYKTLDYGAIRVAADSVSTTTPIKSFKDGTRYDATDGSYAKYGLIDYGAPGVDASDTYGDDNDGNTDYVTLKFKGTVNGKADQELKFRSYGLGSITDNTAFSWSDVQYAGRTMAQQKFDSVARDISHDLMIVAFTPTELKQNYNRLNKLYQMASPSIDTDGLATSPFCKFTLGDLYTEVNVIIDKITFTVDEDTSWDIGVGSKNTETMDKQLPMVIKLNLGYKFLTNADGGFFSNTSNYWDPIS